MRMFKWAVPVVVFGFLLAGVAPRVTAEETKKTGGIKGTVVDKDGKAVGSAKVELFPPHEKGSKAGDAPKAEAKAARLAKGEKGARPAPIAETTSDSEGKFNLADVAEGKYTVMARAKGIGGGKQDVEVKAGETAEVKLELKEMKHK